TLVGAMGRDLIEANESQACRDYLRAAVDRYPHDPWLHNDLGTACTGVAEPDESQSECAEALRHHSVASGQRPHGAWVHLMVAVDYEHLGSYDRAIAAYRKVISLSPFFAGIANLWMGEALLKKQDWEAAIAALREAIRLLKGPRAPTHLATAHVYLGAA